MSTQNPHEIWQIDAGGRIYEAPFGELGDWIGEGSLQPDDKVRKGNLRWIEARRVPGLIPFFNAKHQGLPMPVVVSTTDAAPAEPTTEQQIITENLLLPPPSFIPIADPVEHSIAVVPAEPLSAKRNPDFCVTHIDVPTVFLCDGCGNGFCKVCPNAYGGSVRICPLCRGMCRTLNEVVQKRAEKERRVSAMSEGFGTADFFNALAHPFNFKASLFFGALMFMAFSVGQSVTALGGIYMMVSALFCLMLANMLTFGVLANTVNNFAHGHLAADFMPSFEDFNIWDDVIHPLILSIGAYASSFGPFIVVMLIGLYLITSNVNSQMDAFQQKVDRIPGTHYYDNQRTVDQSEKVKDVLGNISNKHNERLRELQDAASGSAAAVSNGNTESVSARETREQEELWAMAQESRKQGLESAIGKAPDTRAKESEAMVQSFLGLAAPLVVIGGIVFLWGLFYYPAACAVAGYTRSFAAAINPLVGLDTIKRLGGTYIKILLMGLVLLFASGVVGAIAGAVLAPFDMPGMGNLPAKAIGALFGFYVFTVFSCILGYALYKNSDKLNLHS